MNDPYKRYNRSLEAAASGVYLITPNDDAPIPRGIKRLRVFNSLDEIAFLHLRSVGGDDVTLAFPPYTLVWEDLRVSHIYATGTEPSLQIHGYTDYQDGERG